MRDELTTLVASVESARSDVLNAAVSLTEEQGAFNPRDAWSIAETVEHLYLAELSGVTKIWAAAEGLRAGDRWTGELPHRGKQIEQVEGMFSPAEARGLLPSRLCRGNVRRTRPRPRGPDDRANGRSDRTPRTRKRGSGRRPHCSTGRQWERRPGPLTWWPRLWAV
ncbi:MAG: DinB family protein [candidate division Zixibacteria bacterium]|nr:DinB family protein [candidate division Zixibacteria bacterium]